MIKVLSLFVFLTAQLRANTFEQFENELLHAPQQHQSSVTLKQSNHIMLAGEGSISGTLYEIDSNDLIADESLLNISLIGRVDDMTSWSFVTSVDVVNSSYNFTGLADGEYYLSVYSPFPIDQEDRPLYMPTLWNENNEIIQSSYNVPNESIISIVDGEIVQNINFHLTPAAILVVTDNANHGETLFNLQIINSDNEFSSSTKMDTTSIVGNIAHSNTSLYSYLPVGDYRFAIHSEPDLNSVTNYVDYLYGVGNCYACKLELFSGKGDTVMLHRSEKKIIDVNRSKGATISGKLILQESANDNQFYSFLNLIGTHGNAFHFAFLEDDVSDSGEYQISGIAAGEYRLTFNRYGYMRSQFKNFYCPISGCEYYDSYPIRITEGEELSNINAYLKKGLRVSGSIVDNETGESLIGSESLNDLRNYIELYNEDYTIVGRAYNRNQLGSSYITDHGIPEGNYYIRTGSSVSDESNNLYVNQVYPNIECEGILCDFSQAELISLKSNEDLKDINFKLNRAKFISGMVVNNTGEGIENISVAILNQQGKFVNFVRTDVSGRYKIGGLKSGSYYVRTYNGNKKLVKFDFQKKNMAHAWVNKIYPNQSCINEECTLNVDNLVTIEDNNVDNIDFILEQGTLISGQVKNKIKNIGIQDIEIKIFSESGEYMQSYFTDEYGYYATSALQAGSYRVVTSNDKHYVNQAYGGYDCGLKACHALDSDIVAINDLNSENINFNVLAGKDYYPALSGLWYNSNQSGHGLQIEVIKSKESATLQVSWYAVHNGQPIWLTGTGPLNKDIAYVDLNITNGANFPPDFSASDVQVTHWGLLRLDFSDLNNVEVSWETELDGFENGSMPMQRLTNLSHSQSTGASIDSCFSGTFYNPEENVHGVMIEVLDGDVGTSLAITWFVYNEGQQFWLLGSAPIQNDDVTVPAIFTSDSNFPPNFDTSQLQINNWGVLKIHKIDNNNLELEWMPNSENTSFGSGSMSMTRLTSIEGLGC